MYANTHTYSLAISLRGLGDKQHPNIVAMNIPRTQIMASKYHPSLRESLFFFLEKELIWELDDEKHKMSCNACLPTSKKIFDK